MNQDSNSGIGDIYSILEVFLGKDDRRRQKGEEIYFRLLGENPEELTFQILQICEGKKYPEVIRCLCCVLLRRLANPRDEFWPNFSNELKNRIKDGLLEAWRQEESSVVCRKIADSIAEISSSGEWPEIMENVILSAESSGSQQRFIYCMQLLEKIALTSSPLLSEFQASVAQFVFEAIESTSDSYSAQIASIRAGLAMAISISCNTKQTASSFQFINCQLLSGVILHRDACDIETEDILKYIIDLISITPDFFDEDLYRFLLSLSTSGEFETDLNHLMMEALLTCSLSRPSIILAYDGVIDDMIRIGVEWSWKLVDEDDDDDDDDFGCDVIQEISEIFGSRDNHWMNEILLHVSQLSDSDDFKCRLAAMKIFARLIIGNSKYISNFMEGSLTGIYGLINDTSPRVVVAAVTALGLMILNFGGKLLDKFGKDILNSLIDLLSSDQGPKVKLVVISAICNYCNPEVCKKKFLFDRSNDLLDALFNQPFNKFTIACLDEVITAMVSISKIIGTDFESYYKPFVNFMTEIQSMENVTDDMRGKMFLMFGYVSQSVSSEVCRDDAVEIFNYLLSRTNFDNDTDFDVLQPAICSIAKSFKSDFPEQIVTKIIPLILNVAAIDIDFSIIKESETIAAAGNDEDDYDIKNGKTTSTFDFGPKFGRIKVSLNPQLLANKILAFQLLHEYLELGKLRLGMIVDDIMHMLLSDCGLHFSLQSRIRATSSLSLSRLMHCMHDVNDGRLMIIMKELCMAMEREDQSDTIACMSEAFRDVIKFVFLRCPDQLSLDDALSLGRYTIQRLSDGLKRKSDLVADENTVADQETFDSILENENETLQNFIDACGYLYRIHTDRFNDFYINELLSLFPADNEDDDDNDRLLRICILDDMLENSSLDNMVSDCMSELLPYLDDSDDRTDLKQAAMYGVSIIIKKHHQQLPADALPVIHHFAFDMDAEDDDYAGLIENSLVALGWHLIHTMSLQVDYAVLGEYLTKLPMEDDEIQVNPVQSTLMMRLLELNNVPEEILMEMIRIFVKTQMLELKESTEFRLMSKNCVDLCRRKLSQCHQNLNMSSVLSQQEVNYWNNLVY